MRRLSVFVPIVAIALVGGLAGLRAPAVAVAQDATPVVTDAHPLVGTWLLDTDAADPENAPEAAMFTSDGGYVSVDGEGFVNVGVWEATGVDSATLTVHSPGADEDGELFGTFIVRAEIEVDASGDAFTAEYTGEFVEADGTSSGEYGPATATATRIEAEEPGEPVGTFEELFEQFEEEGTPDA